MSKMTVRPVGGNHQSNRPSPRTKPIGPPALILVLPVTAAPVYVEGVAVLNPVDPYVPTTVTVVGTEMLYCAHTSSKSCSKTVIETPKSEQKEYSNGADYNKKPHPQRQQHRCPHSSPQFPLHRPHTARGCPESHSVADIGRADLSPCSLISIMPSCRSFARSPVSTSTCFEMSSVRSQWVA